jgi:hypothetical protein
MPRIDARDSVAIVGVGLVGGAVLRELVLGWIRGHRTHSPADNQRQPEITQLLNIDKIHVTALTRSELVYQFEKTKAFLGESKSVALETDGDLQLTIHSGNHRLSLEAEALDILPEGLSPSTVEDESFRRESSLYRYLAAKQPKTIVIGANLAAIIAYTRELEELGTLALAWLLTTLKRAADELRIDTVAIVGTTALGGLGTNIAWSHQSSQEMDSALTSKILAAYGILGVLDRAASDTDSSTRWILLTPGSLLGYDYLDFGPVKYFSIPERLPTEVEVVVHNSNLSIPLYEPLEVDPQSPSDGLIDWEKHRSGTPFLMGAKVKCGESGDFSPMQFACISHAFQMGFNTDVHVARILIDELLGKTTGYNQIPLGSGTVLEPTDQGQNERNLAMERLAELELENGTRSPPVYPALGSPRAQKEIVMADLLYRLLTDRFGEPTLQQISGYTPQSLAEDLWGYLLDEPQLLAEITAVIPVISPEGHVWVGPHVMYLNKGIARTSDLGELTELERFREFAAFGAVDLRPGKDSIVHEPKTYETGVEVLIERAQLILDRYVGAFPSNVIDQGGSAIDPRIRHWAGLTSGGSTIFDPVFYVIQFLGGERPYR